MSNNQGTRAATEQHVQHTLPFLAAQYGGRSVTIRRNPDYQATVAAIKRAFNSLQHTPNNRILICARFQGFDDTLQVTDDLWPDVMSSLMLVTIILDQEARSNNHRSGTALQIFIVEGTLRRFALTAWDTSTISDVKAMIQDRPGLDMPPIDQYRLYLGGRPLGEVQLLSDYNIQNGATLQIVRRLRGGKPVIYLLSPMPIPNVHIQLSLVRTWNFSALYPPTLIKTGISSHIDQSITWVVDAKPDGMLFDHGTKREIAYLFWEAHTNPKLLPSPACSRPGTPTDDSERPFDPSSPVVDPNNAVLLPFSKVTSYIDDVLLALGLHTEARTSFITYWLPDLQKHKFIALRFLPQAEYETAAPLSLTPAPEVTTRVFMLFKGVNDNEIGQWQQGMARALEDVSKWQDVVGIDIGRATNPALFRVLEWGGMEVM